MTLRNIRASLSAGLLGGACFLVVVTLFCGLAVAQVGGGGSPLFCFTSVSVTPTMRGEGFTERTGDLTLVCSGGTPPAVGDLLPRVNITLFYNTAVTNRLLPLATVSDALLLIDEPGSGLTALVPGFGPGAPLNLCATPLAGCTEFASQIAGSSILVATDTAQGINATTPGKNGFQGVVSGNSVTFFGVPVLAPGVGASRVFRITNVRVNANPLFGGPGSVSPVDASISISGSIALLLQTPTQIVGYIANGLTATVSGSTSLDQCSSQNQAPVTTLSFTENFGTAFKTRVDAQANILYAGQDGLAVQNVPGLGYNSESYFVVPIANRPTAGLSDFGTRLKAKFFNVPVGVHLFVSVANVLSNGLPVSIPLVIGGSAANIGTTGFAQLTADETGAFGAVTATNFAPGSSGSVPVAEIPIVNGSATAIWEVINANPIAVESFKFAVYTTYAANPSQNSPASGIASVNLSYAPAPPSFSVATAQNASDTLPIPRFIADVNAATDLLTITQGSCTPHLSISKGHVGNFTPGQAGATYTLSVSNTPVSQITSGTVTVTETLPTGLTLVSMAGTGWTCPLNGNTCFRSDPLAAGLSHAAITVTVNVAANAPPELTNQVSVSGGGSASASAADFTLTAAPCSYGLNSTGSSIAPTGGGGSFTVTTAGGCSWNATSNASWMTVTSGAVGSGNGAVVYSVATNLTGIPRSNTIVVGGQTFTVTQAAGTIAGPGALRFVPVTPCRIADTRTAASPLGGPALAARIGRDFNIPASACRIPGNALAYSLNLTVVPVGPLGYLSVWPAGQSQPTVSTLNSGDGRIKANAAIVPAGVSGAVTLFASDPTHVIIDINGYFVPATTAQSLAFYPITPCRIGDTRAAAGALGGPALAPSVARSFPVLAGPCGIPATAQAYALNMTVVPNGPLGFLSAWPAGSPQTGSSTINAPTGAITPNMAIIPAGAGGAFSVFASNATHLIIDINGYFAAPGAGSTDFYTATPCRILDTRNAAGTFGGPLMGAGETRAFPVPSSTCSIPPTAKAYSLNATVVPSAPLGFLAMWGSGTSPFVSTLNALDGTITANAALVPAGVNGVVSAFTTDASHLILDINGYFQ